MRRPICCTEKTPEGRREIRVSLSADAVRWQFLLPGAERWDYDLTPTEADWETLEQKVANIMQRGRFVAAEMDIVRRRGRRRADVPSRPGRE